MTTTQRRQLTIGTDPSKKPPLCLFMKWSPVGKKPIVASNSSLAWSTCWHLQMDRGRNCKAASTLRLYKWCSLTLSTPRNASRSSCTSQTTKSTLSTFTSIAGKVRLSERMTAEQLIRRDTWHSNLGPSTYRLNKIQTAKTVQQPVWLLKGKTSMIDTS